MAPRWRRSSAFGRNLYGTNSRFSSPAIVMIMDSNRVGRVSSSLATAIFDNVSVTNDLCDFSLSASSRVSVNIGGSASTSISASLTPFFSDSIGLSLNGLPAGVTRTFSPGALAGSSNASTLTLSASGSAAAGTYSIRVSGTDADIRHKSYRDSYAHDTVVRSRPPESCGAVDHGRVYFRNPLALLAPELSLSFNGSSSASKVRSSGESRAWVSRRSSFF